MQIVAIGPSTQQALSMQIVFPAAAAWTPPTPVTGIRAGLGTRWIAVAQRYGHAGRCAGARTIGALVDPAQVSAHRHGPRGGRALRLVSKLGPGASVVDHGALTAVPTSAVTHRVGPTILPRAALSEPSQPPRGAAPGRHAVR